MKVMLLIVGLVTLLCTIGCEEEREHRHGEPRGGAYDNYYQGYGHQGYQGYPNYNGWDNR